MAKSNEELLAEITGGNISPGAEANTSGISGLDFGFLGKDTTAAQRLERYNRIAQGLYPVHEKEQYQAQAQQIYPEQNYGREKFFADIMLGLGLISGRSEGGRWAPIAEKELGEYIEATGPFAEAERKRQAQVQQFVFTEEEEDEEKQREFLSTLIAGDINKQMEFMEQWIPMTKIQATAANLPTANGETWERSSTTDTKRLMIQNNPPLKDTWSYIDTSLKEWSHLDTSLGQQYMINGLNDVKEAPGFRLKDGMRVLSDAEATHLGYPLVDKNKKKIRYKANVVIAPNGAKQYKNVDQLITTPLAFTRTLTDPEAQDLGYKTDKGQIYQVNQDGAYIQLPETFWKGSDWKVANEQDLIDREIDIDLYPPGTFFQISPDGKLEQGGTVAMAKERDSRIAYYMDMLTRNAESANDPITPVQAKDMAVKLADKLVILNVDEVGRVFGFDTMTGKNEWLNKAIWDPSEGSEWKLIGQVNPNDPFVTSMAPPTVNVETMTPGVIDATQKKIGELEKAYAQGKQLMKLLENSLGPEGFLKAFAANWLAPILPTELGMQKYTEFFQEASNEQAIKLFTRTLIQALALNPRFPVAEQDIIKDLGLEEDILGFWTDEKMGIANFNETLRFLQNNLNWERASLNPNKEKYLFVDKAPTGSNYDPINMDTPDGMKYMLQIKELLPESVFNDLYFVQKGKKVSGVGVTIKYKD
jgi:hypothetical protein